MISIIVSALFKTTFSIFRIGHDNTGLAPDWMLDKVIISDKQKIYMFPCYDWLAGKGAYIYKDLMRSDQTSTYFNFQIKKFIILNLNK